MPSRPVYSSGIALLLSLFFVPVRASACNPVTRTNVIPCALGQSLANRAEREDLAAAEGRREAAATWLPSNPALSVSAGQPINYALSASSLTWSVSVAQELEVGGQRSHRMGVADAERVARARRVAAGQREVARGALDAYFDALAARDRAALAVRLGAVARALGAFARSRSDVGLLSPVDSAVAQAEVVRLAQIELEAELRETQALATLSSILGQDTAGTTLRLEGELEPLRVADVGIERLVERAIAERADVQVSLAENQAARERSALLKASRVPNPTLSVYYRKDWFDERAAGIGLTLPIPLPAPVGRTFVGEINEANALARRAELDTQKLRRTVRLEVSSAKLALDTRRRERALFTPDSIAQAEAGVDAIGEALGGQRISIRDALLSEQALVELLLDYIEARRELCLASVQLAHAAGFAVERGIQ